MQVILSRYASFSTCTFNAGNGRVVRTCTSVLRLLACYTLQFDASKKERSTQIFFVGRLFARGKKKSKEANRSTSTSEGEDEVLTALSMADDLGKKVDMILNKLQKLDNIEARLDNLHKSIASLEESFAFWRRTYRT